MADFDRLCKAFSTIADMLDAYSVFLEQPKNAEYYFKPLAMGIITDLSKRDAPRSPAVEKLIADATSCNNMARYGDQPKTFCSVMEILRNRIHQNKEVRNYFIGGEEYSDDLLKVMNALEEGDVSDAQQELFALERKAGCPVSARPRHSTTVYYHQQAKGT